MIRAILLAAIELHLAETTGHLASVQWSLLRAPIEGGEALAVAGVLLDLHSELEAQSWALKEARAELIQGGCPC